MHTYLAINSLYLMPTYTHIKACKGALYLSHSIPQYPVLLYYMIYLVHMAMLLAAANTTSGSRDVLCPIHQLLWTLTVYTIHVNRSTLLHSLCCWLLLQDIKYLSPSLSHKMSKTLLIFDDYGCVTFGSGRDSASLVATYCFLSGVSSISHYGGKDQVCQTTYRLLQVQKGNACVEVTNLGGWDDLTLFNVFMHFPASLRQYIVSLRKYMKLLLVSWKLDYSLKEAKPQLLRLAWPGGWIWPHETTSCQGLDELQCVSITMQPWMYMQISLRMY